MNNCKIVAILVGTLIVCAYSSQIPSDSVAKNNETGKKPWYTNPNQNTQSHAKDSIPKSTPSIAITKLPASVDTRPRPKIIGCIHKPPPDSSKDTGKQCEIEKWFSDHKDTAEGVTAVAAILAAFIAYFALRDTRKLIGITSDTASKQLRAYVGIDSLSFPSPSIPFVVKNYGQTPAQQVEIWCACDKDARSIETLRMDPQNKISGGDVLWPGKTVPCRWQYSGPAEGFFIFGTIRYFDAFGIARTTTFQYAVRTEPGRHPTCTVHSEGNSAT